MKKMKGLTRVVLAIGLVVICLGVMTKLACQISFFPEEWKEAAEFWGMVMYLAFGPILLGFSVVVELPRNYGPLPGTSWVTEKIIQKISSNRWWSSTIVVIAHFATMLALMYIGTRFFFPGIIGGMNNATVVDFLPLIWLVPMTIIGIGFMAYAYDIGLNAIYLLFGEEDDLPETMGV